MALVSCGHCIIGVICRVLCLGSCEFSSVEEDELAIFLLSMPVSLPGGKVGVYASFWTISFSFKAVRRVARNGYAKGGHFVHFAPGINWPRGLRQRTIYIYIYTFAPCTLTFTPCAYGVSLLSTGATCADGSCH